MELLRELTRLQNKLGYLDDDTLRQLAREKEIPLYRLEGLVSFYPTFRRTPPPKVQIDVCRDICCHMAGSEARLKHTQEMASKLENVEVRSVSCLGRCENAPAVNTNDVPMGKHSLQDIIRIISKGKDVLKEGITPTLLPAMQWKCDPYLKPEQYYSTAFSLANDLTKLANTCIERLTETGLRGMGGAGFPTGRKWEMVAKETAETKYVICNADESEPGTFKDREILRTLPHLVIEGMLLAGLTTSANKGIIYLRHEYHPEQIVLEKAIQQARARKILGENAARSGQQFDIEVFVSPGGYILGEETALLEALEDKRGEPRNKPPYPGTHGLWGKPTLINNVETFALATSIIHHGPEWWQAQGRDGFSGRMFVSISGDVARPGVFEIPIGTPVSELIEMAGGMSEGTTLKAFLPGGASSNFLRAEHVNTPLDFDFMHKAGSMLGTGAVIVIGQQHDLFELATNLVRFFRNESCGKCVPCRLGSEHAVDLLENVQRGEESPAALQILSELGETLEQTSICGLGQVAINPVLSMMKHFPEEIPAAV